MFNRPRGQSVRWTLRDYYSMRRRSVTWTVFYYEAVAYGSTGGASDDEGDGSAASGGRTSRWVSKPVVKCATSILAVTALAQTCPHYWVTCAHSKWRSVIRMSKYPTMEKITTALNILFTMCGSPKTIVSDNGPQFGSKQFEDWCRSGVAWTSSYTWQVPDFTCPLISWWAFSRRQWGVPWKGMEGERRGYRGLSFTSTTACRWASSNCGFSSSVSMYCTRQ